MVWLILYLVGFFLSHGYTFAYFRRYPLSERYLVDLTASLVFSSVWPIHLINMLTTKDFFNHGFRIL